MEEIKLSKLPPQSLDAEKAVLGAIMINREALYEISDLMRPEMLYSDIHQDIYAAMLELNQRSQPIDEITLFDKLKGKVDKYTLSTLSNNVVSSAHTVTHARQVVEKFLYREQIRIAGEMLNNAYSETVDPFENSEQAEKELQDLMTGLQNTTSSTVDNIAVDVFKELNQLRGRANFLTGVSSGYETLDRLTMGFQKTDLIIIAARPAVGKTAFTLSLAIQAALSGQPSAFFSLEMSKEQLVKRILASQAKIYLSTIRGANMSDEQMEHLYIKGLKPLSGVPMYVDDTASLSVLQLKARLRRMVRKHKIKIAFVDYLQLLKSGLGKNANRHQQIGEISRELKIMAKELHIPIVALSQLSRDIEKRSNSTPQLSDLKESGDIEQDADIVMFLHGGEEESEIYLKVAKHRNGNLESIRFEFDKSFQSFTDQGQGEVRFRKIKIDADAPF